MNRRTDYGYEVLNILDGEVHDTCVDSFACRFYVDKLFKEEQFSQRDGGDLKAGRKKLR